MQIPQVQLLLSTSPEFEVSADRLKTLSAMSRSDRVIRASVKEAPIDETEKSA